MPEMARTTTVDKVRELYRTLYRVAKADLKRHFHALHDKVYLNQLDQAWQRRGCGELCRYADELEVICRRKQEAEWALSMLRTILVELGLAPKETKTRIVHLRDGGEGIGFLGFHLRWVRGRGKNARHLTFLVRWPSRKAMQAARDRNQELTSRKLLLFEEVVEDMNRFMRGWAGYFRYGNLARHFSNSGAMLSRTRASLWSIDTRGPGCMECTS